MNFRSITHRFFPLTFNKLILILILITAFIGIYFSANHLLANLSYYSTRNISDAFAESPQELSIEQVKKAKKNIKEAIMRHPTHPHYHSKFAFLLEWEAFLEGDIKRKYELFDDAASYHKQALNYRPTWPMNHISLAKIKWQKGELDDEFLRHLKLAHEFGPSKIEVNMATIEFALYLYSNNNLYFLNLRDFAKHSLNSAFKNGRTVKNINQIVEQTKTQKLVCILLADSDRVVKRRARCEVKSEI